MDEQEEPVVEIDAQEFTDIEKQLILQVVARDEDVRLQEKSRLDNLKVELRHLKERGVPDGEEEEYGRVCKRCRTPLGIIFNSGAFCPTCGYKVCKGCRLPIEKSMENPNDMEWTCTVCAMFRAIRAESGAWFYSGPDQPTAKKKVYGSMLIKRIFSIAKKRDKVIYKDPIWNEIIHTDEIEEIEEEPDDDYLVIASKKDGEYSFSEGNNSSIEHVLGDNGEENSTRIVSVHHEPIVDDPKPMKIADLANNYNHEILDADSCLGSEVTSPVQQYSEPINDNEKKIVEDDSADRKIDIYYSPDMEHSSSEDEGVYDHQDVIYEHPDENLYENGIADEENISSDQILAPDDAEVQVVAESNHIHGELEVNINTKDSAQKNDEACSPLLEFASNGIQNSFQYSDDDSSHPHSEKIHHVELDINYSVESCKKDTVLTEEEDDGVVKEMNETADETKEVEFSEEFKDLTAKVEECVEEVIEFDVDDSSVTGDIVVKNHDVPVEIEEMAETTEEVSIETEHIAVEDKEVSVDIKDIIKVEEVAVVSEGNHVESNIDSANEFISDSSQELNKIDVHFESYDQIQLKEEISVNSDMVVEEWDGKKGDEMGIESSEIFISQDTDLCQIGLEQEMPSEWVDRESKIEKTKEPSVEVYDNTHSSFIDPDITSNLNPPPTDDMNEYVEEELFHHADAVENLVQYNLPKDISVHVESPGYEKQPTSDMNNENVNVQVSIDLEDTMMEEPVPEVTKPTANGHVIKHEEEDIDAIVSNFKLTQDVDDAETASIISDHSEDGDARPLKTLAGEILIGLKYDHNDQVFEIQIHKAKDLPAGDVAKVTADPYVKVYLNSATRSLGKKKTKAKKSTLNPEFDEVLSFKVKHEELITSTVDLSVWHYEFSNHNVTLGEVRISLEDFLSSGFSLDTPIPRWYTLHSKRLHFTQLTFCGELILSLQYKAPGTLVADTRREQRKLPNPTKGQLHINIIQAKGLRTEEDTFYSKISLVISEKNVRRMKSKYVSGSQDPYWDEDFIVDNISWAELESSYLQIAIRAKQKNSIFICGCRLGLGKSTHLKHDCFGEEVKAWQSMLDHTNEPMDFCIPLRDNLDSVKVDMAVPPRTVKEITDEEYDEKKKMKKDSLSSSSVAKRFLNADALSVASSGSMLSIYSSAGGQGGALIITGEILFAIKHDLNSNVFSIEFVKAKGIAAANAKQQTSDPYVKVYLFPDKTKSTKKKTSHRRKTINPVWNETIKYTINRDELMKKTLQVSIWNHDRFGRNDFLGEVQLNIKHYSSSNDLSVNSPVWYTLQEMAPISMGGVDENKGEIKLGIRFDHEVLNVHVKQANGLFAVDPANLPNPFVKCYLLPDKSRKSKRKTGVQKKTIAPVWNEKFDYKGVEVNDLYSRVLEVTVWDHNTSGHQFLGGLRLGLPHGDEYWHDCFGKEINIWEAMMKHLGILAEYAIPLRSTMTSRKGQINQELPMVTAALEDKAPIVSLSSDYPTEGPLMRISLQYIEPPVIDDPKKKKKKAKGSLKVHLKEAKNLPIKSEEDVPSTFCKGYIHPKKKSSKMKTETYIKSANPLWDTEMLFEGVTLDELRTRALQIDVYDEINEKKKELVGFIRLGSGGNTEKWDDSTGIEVEIWRSMLNNPSQSVMIAVPLRITQEILPDLDLDEEDDYIYEDSISMDGEVEEIEESNQAGSESPRTAALRAMGVHAANVVGMMNDDKADSGLQDTALAPIAEESDTYQVPDIIVSDVPEFLPEEDVKPGDPPFPGAGMDQDEDSEEELKMKQKKKQPPSFSLLKKSMSQESLSSIYSTDSQNVYGQVPIRGDIQFGMKYDYAACTFEVHVFQAKDIAAVDTKKEISDPYCKVYLLPDKTKSGKRKTTTRKKTLCPEWEEILEFKISLRDLRTRTLWLALWHLERFGRNIFLGEVMLNMDSLIDGGTDLETSTPKWYTLCEKGVAPKTDLYKGEIKFSIVFEDEGLFGKQTRERSMEDSSKKKKKKKEAKGTGKINIHIKECYDLPAADRDGFSDPFCKCYLLPNKSSKTKRKTPIIRHTRNPVWDYKFEYPCDYEDLADHGIEFGVWDWDRGSRNDFLGCCRINLGTRVDQWDDAEGIEIEAWQHLIDHPNVWKEFIIPLRSKLDPRGDPFK